MKSFKRAVALLVALAMMFAASVPVRAYDAEGIGQGPTTYEITRVYHEVVRGDTLSSIAAFWGTVPALIVHNNWNYFQDLRLRNITYGLVEPLPQFGLSQFVPRAWANVPILLAAEPIRLEPGVRLHIYDVLEVRYYVRRGDTIEGIIGGNIVTQCGFPVVTTLENFLAENASWFVDRDRVNLTLDLGHTLIESQEIGSVFPVTHTNPLTGGVTTFLRGLQPGGDSWGAPVHITIPIRAWQCLAGPWDPTCAYLTRYIPGYMFAPTLSATGIAPARQGTLRFPQGMAYRHLFWLRPGPDGQNLEVDPWLNTNLNVAGGEPARRAQWQSFNPPPTRPIFPATSVPFPAVGLSLFPGAGGPDAHFQITGLQGGYSALNIPGPVGAFLLP